MDHQNKLPMGWSFTSIGELIKNDGVFIDGDWIESKDQNPNGNIRLIQLADIGDGYYRNKSNRFLTIEKAVELNCTFLKAGDLLIARMPDPLGRACIFPGDIKDSITAVDVCIVRTESDGANHFWLMYAINSPQFRSMVESLQSGSTRKRISRSNLAKITFPLPPIPEQERIVERIESLFTQLDAGVAGLKRAQVVLKRYKASVLKAACEGRLVLQDPSDEPAEEMLVNRQFVQSKKRMGRLWGAGSVPALLENERILLPDTWVWVKVTDVGFNVDDVVQVGPMSMQSKDFIIDGIPVLNVGCVQWGYIDETKLNFLPDYKAKEFERYRILSGDVLFTRSGTVGRSAVAKDHQNHWLMTFHLLRVRPNPRICISQYLQIVFEGAPHIRRQTRDASIGTTRAGFNTNLLAMLDIPLPPIIEQQRIVAEVEQRLSVVKELEQTIEGNLKRASRLRQAILKRAFEGRLV
jgi:type I restriction enzyme, S subunit